MAENRQLSNAEIVSNDTFERLRSRNSRRRVLRVLSYIFIGLLTCALFITVCVLMFFKIAVVEITGAEIYGNVVESMIEFTGIELDQNLYSVKSSVLRQNIVTEYSYIKDVKIKRHIPDRIEIQLIEDKPVYYIVIGGEYFILSSEFRVLEKVDNSDRIARINSSYKLIRLELPVVKYAVVGKPIVFKRETNFNYVKDMLDFIQNSDIVYDISKLNIVNKFNNYFIYNNYKIVLGNNENIEAKLILARDIIDRISNDPGIIYVTDITKGSVRQDGQVVIE
jgi:Cell division septal protein